MGKRSVLFGSAGILAATTLGAGIFALPYAFQESGWLTGLFYLLALGCLIVFVHSLYWRTLSFVHEKQRLLGLTERYMGKWGHAFASAAIIGGLILALVVYLILAGQFIALLFPSSGGALGTLAFWIIGSLPLMVSVRWLAGLESLAAVLMAALIIVIFISSGGAMGESLEIPAVNFKHILFPFGIVLFSLAGWTAIEPMYEYGKKSGGILRRPLGVFALGTGAVVLLYLLFVQGVFNSTSVITPDTVSGLLSWPLWKLKLLGALGLFALWTSYVPISVEIKNSLEKDAQLPKEWGLITAVGAPILLFALGLTSFIDAIGLAGGVFLGLQYVCILFVSRKVLPLGNAARLFANLAIVVFVLAALYEVYHFAIK